MMVDAVFKGLAQFRVLNTCLYQGFRADDHLPVGGQMGALSFPQLVCHVE
jgi:hypothetical protein